MKSQDLVAIRELPVKELKFQLGECESKIFKLKISNSISKVKNPLEIRNLKRHRARLITWIAQKEKKGEGQVSAK